MPTVARDVDDVRVDRVVDELLVVEFQMKRLRVHNMRTLPAIIRFELSGCTLIRIVRSLLLAGSIVPGMRKYLRLPLMESKI